MVKTDECDDKTGKWRLKNKKKLKRLQFENKNVCIAILVKFTAE